MDLDRALIYSVVKGGFGALQKVRDLGITTALQGDCKGALEFVYDFNSKYGGIPPIELVTAHTGLFFEPVDAPIEFFIDRVLDRRLHNRLRDVCTSSANALDRFQSQEAYALLEAALGEIRKERLVASKVENLFSLGPDVVAFYDRIKAGERGILTPWASFNDVTMGFWPEDLVLFAARTGVGKTWMALQLANAAWEAGHRVLFITTEMSKIRIASRFYAVHLHLPYKRLRLGQLGDFAESRFRQRIEALKEMKGIDLIGGQFDFHLDSVWSAIESAKPHIVFIDGVYLLRTSGGGESRTDKTAYIFDELKRMAKHFKVPFIVTTQFNRMATQGKTLSSALATEKLALTDVAGWNADLILGLAQTEDMKRDRRLMMLYLKIREGEGEGLELNWDFETMNFSEISKDREGAGDADEYGTGFAASPDALAKEDDLPF